MEPVTLLLYAIMAVCLGLVLLPLLKRLLQHLLPIIRQRCQTAITWLTSGVRGAFHWAWSFLSNQGKLSPAEALSQQVGALIIMSAAVVFGASDLLFTYATLGPLLGWEVDVSTGLFAFLDQLTALCVIALPIVFGFVITDLLQWTAMSHFAFITRGRVGALIFAVLNFLAAIAIALGVYRWLVMNEGGSVPQATGWMLTVPATILLPLAALLLVGLAVALTSVERFIAGVLALVMTIGGLALGVVLGVLYFVDVVLELTVEMLAALPTTRPGPGAVQTGLARLHRSIGSFRTRMVDRLKALVGEGETTSPKEAARMDEPATVASRASTAAPTPTPAVSVLSAQLSQPPGTNETVTHATQS